MSGKSPILSNASEVTREEFKSYWIEEHGAPTLENMMLDSNAATMDVLERPEILAELPSLNSKTVLELGAGIGRFSSAIAEKATKVISVDFVEASCKINRESNSRFKNLEVVCEDALKLSFPANSFDIVFSNWLLMYLTDEEVQTLATYCLNWLKPGGRIFFRESCYHRSGNVTRSWNPTIYRDPRSYFQFFNSARGSSDGSSFQLCKTSCVHAYVRMKNNPNQVWWIWEKCTSGHLVRYLDTQQYDYNSVFRYEEIYGYGFISTGGIGMIENITNYLGPKVVRPGMRVLDVGCGLGGNMLHYASHGCFVHGIDISGIMVSITSERYLKYSSSIQEKISICVGDIFDSNYIPNSFDLICCRDFLMHFSDSDKNILLSKFKRWLAPGGSVVITDYTLSRNPSATPNHSFTEYVKERNYHLIRPSDYEKYFTNLNFSYQEITHVAFGVETFSQYLENQLNEYVKMVERRNQEIESAKMRIKEEVIFDSTYKAILASLAPADGGVTDGSREVDELAVLVAQASADIAKKFRDSRDAKVEEEKRNIEWAKKYWGIKVDAARNGDLGYCVYVATAKCGQ
jgi:phosphoethanolamine N-methyltransferase